MFPRATVHDRCRPSVPMEVVSVTVQTLCRHYQLAWCRVAIVQPVVPCMRNMAAPHIWLCPLQRRLLSKWATSWPPINVAGTKRRPRMILNDALDTARPVFRTKQELVYASLRDAILTCAIPPDERLVIEDVARRLNVSAIPVREALQLLRSEGLVTLIPHMGATVTPLSRDSVRRRLPRHSKGLQIGGRAGWRPSAPTRRRALHLRGGKSGRWTRPWPTRGTTRGPT